MSFQITKFITEYSGAVPNRQGDTPIVFADNVYNYQLWIDQYFTPDSTALAGEINQAISEINTLSQNISNQAVDGGYSQSYINDSMTAKYNQLKSTGGEVSIVVNDNTNVAVYKNSVKLYETTDYTLNADGVTIDFVNALVLDDFIQVWDTETLDDILKSTFDLKADKIYVDANKALLQGDNTKTFKVADAVNADEAVSKGQLLTEMKAVDGAGSGLDADLLRGLPAEFTSSKATNGYQKLPSGLIIQWGRYYSASASVTVTFPIAFPNACFSVTANGIGAVGRGDIVFDIQSISSTSFGALYNYYGDASYIAIGY